MGGSAGSLASISGVDLSYAIKVIICWILMTLKVIIAIFDVSVHLHSFRTFLVRFYLAEKTEDVVAAMCAVGWQANSLTFATAS